MTTWDTNLESSTTVTLGLAGTVDATIDWGEGTITPVTTPGPHTHDYGVDGVYTVAVTGSVTAYNSDSNGGPASERAKLVTVDQWGDLGFTSLRRAFAFATNLTSVPTTSEGIEDVTQMRGMFLGATSFDQDIGGWNTSNVTDMMQMFSATEQFNQDIGGWDTGNVTRMRGMFFLAEQFNQDLSGWDTGNVTDMAGMFNRAERFNQDLSGWCVELIEEEPEHFDTGAIRWTLPRPVWGTCPGEE